MKRRDFLTVTALLPFAAVPGFRQQGLWSGDRGVTAAAFGGGADGINRAISRLSAEGGGVVEVTQDTILSSPIVAANNVSLWVPAGVTVRMGSPAKTMIDWGTAIEDFSLDGGGSFDVAGRAIYCALGTATLRPYIGNVRFENWKRGPTFQSGAGRPTDQVRVRGLVLGKPFVHPTDPTRRSDVRHGLRITCRPSQGEPLVPWVDIDGYTIAESIPGPYGATNEHTADQLTLQGVIGGRVRNVVTMHGGEVGFSMSFSCRNLDLENVLAARNDGNGIYIAGSHYRLDLAKPVGSFQAGETVKGGTSGATGEVEYLTRDVLWIKEPSRAKFRDGEAVVGTRSGATAGVLLSNYTRDIRVHDSCEGIGNGINAGSAREPHHQGLYVQHAENIGVGGTYAQNRPNGVKIGSSSYYMLGRLDVAHNPVPLVEVGSSVLGAARGPESGLRPSAL